MSAPSLSWLLPATDPAPVEATADAAGQALYDAMLPLHTYRAQLRGRPDLTPRQFEHLRHIEALLDAIVADQQQTGQLLTVLRANAAGLNAQLHAAIDRGEAPAWLRNPDPTPAELLAEREADPVYRLGAVRGYRRGCADTERKYQALTSLYAQYAVLVPPPGQQPSPLAAQVQASCACQASLPRLDYPLDARQALAALTADHLPDPRRAA